MKLRGEGGFGLMLLIAILSASFFLLTGTGVFFVAVAKELQLRQEQIRAYYLTQAGAQYALYRWRSSNANPIFRRYAPTNGAYTQPTNSASALRERFRSGVQADFLYFSFNEGDLARWTTVAGRRRLQEWRVRNIRTSIAGTTDNVRITRCRVRTYRNAGGEWVELTNPALNLRRIVMNGTVVASGSFASGADINMTDRVLVPGQFLSGVNTYLEYMPPAMPNPIRVTVQFECQDNSTTLDSHTVDVVFWSGAQNGLGRPKFHTFGITATGKLLRAAPLFNVLDSARFAIRAYTPGQTGPRVMKRQRLEKSLA